MRRDFQVAILLALAAIPAGVALMAAPYYAESALKAYAAQFFWGGLGLTALPLLGAIIIAVRGEAAAPKAGHGRRMIALAGMIVCGLGFLGFAAAYFWPTGRTPTNNEATHQLDADHALPQSTVNAHPTFRYMFDNDLGSSGGGVGQEFIFTNNITKQSSTIPIRLMFQIESRTKFLTIFIPSGAQGYEACMFILSDLERIFATFDFIVMESRIPGDSSLVYSKDFVFSKTIYINMETDLSLEEQENIKTSFKKAGILVQFRGLAYYVLNWNDPKFRAILPAPANKLTSPPIEPLSAPALQGTPGKS